MVEEIIKFFCLCDEYLKTLGYKDHCQSQMSASEILKTAAVGAKFFEGNYKILNCYHC